MLTTAIAAFVWASGSGATLWLNTYSLENVPVEQPGEYAVWICIPVDAIGQISLAGQTLEARYQSPKKGPEYGWACAGRINIQTRSVNIKVGDKVAGIALSTAADFDPQRVQEDFRALPMPRAAEDRRAATVRHTNTVFTMPHFSSKESWESMANLLRRRILLSSGLYPLPEKTSLNAKIFDRITHEDYSVEKVYFEARPGLLVTGNLYRPRQGEKVPAVICPHGHWENGRLENSERGSVPGRCITLARMGAVVFSYDMVGYVDNMQFPHNWGGDEEKLWGLHPFAVQLWTSIRAIDFVQSLPEVDPERIGCTGASGGGTQTFAVAAVDPRIKVAAPVNMISSTMQGGCLCENAPIIRMANSNMEIGALMAPRPLLMVSATGDWTTETPHVEFPAIHSIYALYGAENQVMNVHIHADHNYNQASREAMYRFFDHWLLGREMKESFPEPPFQVDEEAQLRVFPDKKLPKGLPSRSAILAQIIESTQDKWTAVLPKKSQDPADFRAQYGTVLADILGASIPEPNDFDSQRLSMDERDGYVVEHWLIQRTAVRDAIPALLYRKLDATPQDAVVLVHGAGKSAFADLEKGGPGPLTAGLMAQGKAVLCIDAFLTGEHHGTMKPAERIREGKFMDTFQPTDTGYRVQDVLTATAFLRARRDMTGRVNVAGLAEAGLWCVFASAIDGQIPVTVADLNQFPLDDDSAWVKTYYIPCIRSVGDIKTAVAMIEPDRRLVLMNPAPKTAAWDGVTFTSGLLDTTALVDALK